jgi:hypothetical protein
MGRPRDEGWERSLRNTSDMHVQLICFGNPRMRRVDSCVGYVYNKVADLSD